MYAYYGFLGMPFLVLQDMDLIKDVLIKDFDHFLDRRFENSFSNWDHIKSLIYK